jgi:hypothetical protein
MMITPEQICLYGLRQFSVLIIKMQSETGNTPITAMCGCGPANTGAASAKTIFGAQAQNQKNRFTHASLLSGGNKQTFALQKRHVTRG